MRNDKYVYFVEGECERKLIGVFKEQKDMIKPGSVNLFNVINKVIPDTMLRTLGENTVVVLVFDTDVENTETLNENIEKLKKHKHVKNVLFVLQVKNLEDELVRSTDVHSIKELLGSKSNKDFKRDFLHEKRVFQKLTNHSFDYSILWTSKGAGPFSAIKNDGYLIKILKR